MGNHRRNKLSIMGSWNDVTLHDISDVTSMGEYENTRAHALREEAEFNDIDYRVYKLIDNVTTDALRDVDLMRHVVFDAAYVPSKTISENGTAALESTYRESLFSLVVDRVVVRHLADRDIYLATIVAGDNITTTGDVYEMQPAMHLLVDGSVEHSVLSAMVADIYDYMAVHGYVITGEPSDFLIDL